VKGLNLVPRLFVANFDTVVGGNQVPPRRPRARERRAV
jgi:hypothetical protein